MGDARTYDYRLRAARRDLDRRHDRRLLRLLPRFPRRTPRGASSTRCAASTASSTTSPRSRPAPSSGSEDECEPIDGEVTRCALMSLLLHVAGLIIIVVVALSGSPALLPWSNGQDIPAWLQGPCWGWRRPDRKCGLAAGACALPAESERRWGKNPCYFAMDATRAGGVGRRFYMVCEADQTFRAVPSGHGNGRL